MLLAYIVVGGIAGWIATMLMHEDWRYGPLANIILGAFGAWIASVLLPLAGGPAFSGWDLTSFFVALAGAIVLIILGRMFRGERV